MSTTMKPIFFANKEALRAWFGLHHKTASEMVLSYYRVATGRPTVSWSESVDEALCVGWIDGVRRRIDDDSYTIRFTPRRPGSIWSAVNIAKVAALTEQGLMLPEGIAAYGLRKDDKSAIYAYENEAKELKEEYEAIFRQNEKAWAYWCALSPGYRKVSIHLIMSAKQEATRQKRLAAAIAACERGERP